MQFVLDHISALIIASAVILIIAVIQVRGSFDLIESTVSESVERDAISLHEMLQWDIVHMTTEDQTNDRAADGKYFGGSYECAFSQSGDLTDTLTFAALSAPFDTTGAPPLDSLHAIKVSYALVPNGDSTRVWSDTTELRVPLYRLQRSVNDTLTGFLSEIITDFQVQQLSVGGGPEGFVALNGPCPSNMRALRYEYRVVTPGVDFKTTDQRNTNRLNQRQFGITVNLDNYK
ncbi:MAG: hypothetical protein KTR29_12480 [Rhodothermaceae bacterium]|nr:hypothetical protein [Rhodothermaceae bacterium]